MREGVSIGEIHEVTGTDRGFLYTMQPVVKMVEKQAGNGNSAMEVIDAGKVDLVINIQRAYDAKGRPDGSIKVKAWNHSLDPKN